MTSSHSKEFFEFIKKIGESKSKQEEDKIIIKELGTLKSKLNENVSSKKRKELIVRMVYCEMLGHQADFGHIHAVKITASSNIIEKRIGYLAASLCLGNNYEFKLLMVNQMQRDMKSSNYLEVCAALTAAPKLVLLETIPAILPSILPLLDHNNACVRKKAIMALHAFENLSPGCEPNIVEHARKAVIDPDPSVMGASLSLIYDLVKVNPDKYKNLVPGLVSILKQITEHRLSRDFDYHRMPAPWIQVKLLKILAFLGADDEETSSKIYEVLHEALKRADYGLNIGYAVQYECVQTITTIYPDDKLLEAASDCISRFIRSDSNNLKYLGLTGLAYIVKINPKYAVPHQMVVIDCLEDPDETLKRKTLELLYTMTNQANADVIVDRLVTFLRTETSIDSYLRSELVNRIIDLAIRYSRSITWYIEIMNKVFELGPSYVDPNAVHNMLRVIQNEDEDDQIRTFCVETYAAMAETSVLPDVLIQVISWVLGEYGHLSREYTPEQLIDRLCDLAERNHEKETTRSWIISALMKLVAGLGYFPDSVNDILDNFKDSRNVDLQQRCYECLGMRDRMFLLQDVLPPGVGDEELEIDEEMSFLDNIVEEALEQGAPDYDPPDAVEYEKETEDASLRIEQYQKPKTSFDENLGNIMNKTTASQPLHSGMGVVNESANAFAENYNDAVGQQQQQEEEEEETLRGADQDNDETLVVGGGGGGSGLQLQASNAAWSLEGYQPNVKTETAYDRAYNASNPNEQSSNNYGEKASSDNYRSPTMETSSSPSMKETYGSRSKQDAEPAAVDPQKKMLAQSIFGAVNDEGAKNSVAPKIKRKRRSRRKGRSETSSQSSPAPPAEDMLALNIDDNNTHIQQNKSENSFNNNNNNNNNAVDDLFNGMSTSDSGQQMKQNNAQPSPISNDNNNNNNNNVVGNSTSNDPLEDLFSSLPQTGNETPDTSAMKPLSNNLTKSLDNIPSAFPIAQNLCSDELLNCTYNKYWANDHIKYVMFINAGRGYTLSNIEIQIQSPAKFKTNLVGEPNPRISGARTNNNNNNNTHAVSFSSVSPSRSAMLIVELSPTDAGFGTNLMGRISYSDEQRQSKFLTFNSSLTLSDMIRPQKMTTGEYAKMWKNKKQLGHDQKKDFADPDVTSVNEFLDILSKQLNMHKVDVKKTEILSCGQMITGDLVLMYTKVSRKMVNLRIKSSNKNITGFVSSHVSKTIKSQ